MSTPSERAIAPSLVVTSLVVLGLATVGIVWHGLPLMNDVAPAGILSFELARYAQDAAAIVESWQPAGPDGSTRVDLARANLRFDFAFILVYVAALALLCWFVADWLRGLAARDPKKRVFERWLGGFGRWVAGGVVLAGLLDVVENLALLELLALPMLEQQDSPVLGNLARTAFTSAAAKFLLLGLVVVFLAGVVVAWQRRFPLLQFLYFCRFSILAGLFLLFFGPVSVGPAASFLRNLFAVRWFDLIGISAILLLCAWTVQNSLDTMLSHAPERLLPGLKKPNRLRDWLAKRWWIRLAFTALLVAPMLLTVFVVSQLEGEWEPEHFAGVVLGFAVAMSLLFVSAVVQRRYGDASVDFHKELFPAAEGAVQAVESRLPGMSGDERRARKQAVDQEVGGRKLLRFLAWAMNSFGPGYVDPETKMLYPRHLHAIIFYSLAFVVYLVGSQIARPDSWGAFFPSLGFVLLIVLLVTWFLPGLSFLLDRYRLPVTLVLVAWATLVNVLPLPKDHFFEVADGNLATVEVIEAFRARLQHGTAADQAETGEPLAPVVVVAASGGGIRAALWTATVLTELEEQLPGFGPSVHLISTASGGSVGAMFYLAHRAAADGAGDGGSEGVRRDARTSSLHAAAWGLAYPDFWRTGAPLLPLDKSLDRGWAMEQAWQRTLAPTLVPEHQTLAHFAGLVRSGEIPSFIFNSTVIETGEPFLISPLSTEGWRAASYTRAFPGIDLGITTAARLSATFPWVTPMSRAEPRALELLVGRDQRNPLSTQEQQWFSHRHHLGDGGYYDNYGVVSSLRWLDELFEDQVSRAELAKRGVILVLINAYEDRERQVGDSGQPAPLLRTRMGSDGWLFATLGPLQGLLSTWGSSQINRNTFEVEQFQKRGWAPADPAEFANQKPIRIEKFVFDLRANASLSWKLTKNEQDRIQGGVDEPANQTEIDRLRRYFGAAGLAAKPVARGPKTPADQALE